MFFKKITAQNKIKFLELSLAVFLVFIGVGLRLLPHPPNFSPIAALALFSGVYLSRKVAFFLPIAVMVISDIFIGYYEIKLMTVVYGSFLICVLLGFWLKKHKKWYNILGGSILAAILFFILTNLAVWLFTSWYSKNLLGIIQCYLMALPFLKNTLFSNLFYTICFFGLYELIRAAIKKKYGYPVYKSSLV